MNRRAIQPVWYRTSTGKFVVQDGRARFEASTEALVQDLIDLDQGGEPLGHPQEKAIQTTALGIAESPLPFEPVHEWMTWMIQGNELSH